MAQLVVVGLRGVRVFTDFFGLDIGTSLAPLIATDRPRCFTTRNLNAERSELEGMTVWSLQPSSPSGKYVLALHGGAYVVQPTVIHWIDYAKLARETGATVVVPIYPLAPDGTAGTVVPVVADMLASMIDRHGSQAVSVYGDSAGGAIALSAVQTLISRHESVPARMVLLSPVLDHTMTNPETERISDPVLRVEMVKEVGRLWAGSLDRANPLVSPLQGSFENFPPTAIYSGSLDLLSADVARLQDKTRAQGAPFTYVLRTGLLHVWPIGQVLPEARKVRPQLYRQLLGSNF